MAQQISYGIANQGSNTCFISASVQVLCASPVLMQYLCGHRNGAFRSPVEAALYTLAIGLRDARRRSAISTRETRSHWGASPPFSAIPLLETVRQNFSQHRLLQNAGRQFDCAEFLDLLIESIPGFANLCGTSLIPIDAHCEFCGRGNAPQPCSSISKNIADLAMGETMANIIEESLAHRARAGIECGLCKKNIPCTAALPCVLLVHLERRSMDSISLDRKFIIYSQSVRVTKTHAYVLRAVGAFQGTDDNNL
jgi:hypothetical protein